MRDWQAVVREKLRDLRLDPARQQEIVAELAAHLEDLYQEFLAQGLCNSDALQRSLEEVTDWPGLATQIQRAKHEEEVMNTRTKQLWFPGLVSLASAMIVWTILERIIAPQARVVSVDKMTLAIYLPELALLPCCGAAGAYLSRRGGGSRLARTVSGLLPSIVLIGVIVLILPLEFLYGRTPFVTHHPFSYLGQALAWITIPSLALLLGAAPFLRRSKPEVS